MKQKRVVIIIFTIAIIISLAFINSGCSNTRKKPICGNNICEQRENCPEDCKENTKTTTPSVTTTIISVENKHFGVDGLGSRIEAIEKINEIKDGVSGFNGLKWEDVELKQPINGNHLYAADNEFRAMIDAMNKAGRQLQLNVDADSSWATIKDGYKRNINIRPEYMDDWGALIKHLVKNYPVSYLQISSEAENFWGDADGYTKALCAAYKAAKEANPKVRVMAAGFNVGVAFSQPEFNQGEKVQQEMLNENPEFKRKIDFILYFLSNGKDCYDILTLHLNRDYVDIPPVVGWFKQKMQENGYQKAIWSDDMSSGPFLTSESATEEELRLFDKLKAGDPETVAWFRSEQAKLSVKKPATAFVSGVDRVFISGNIDWSGFQTNLAIWRYMGLLDSNIKPKPAFYTYKILVLKLDGFKMAERLDEQTYKFSFANKNPVYVLWNEQGSMNKDLSKYILTEKVTLTHIITQAGKTDKDAEINIVQTNSVPIDDVPIFIETG